MILQFEIGSKQLKVNTDHYIDLSFPLKPGSNNPNAYHIGHPKFQAFCAGTFVGDVSQGGACNCEDITFNAHGNGTHTEGIGHITSERIAIRDVLTDVWAYARVLSVTPSGADGSQYIDHTVLDSVDLTEVDALIIRTLPNDVAKNRRIWSGSNPPFFTPEFMRRLVENDVQHLLTDLPSVDPEEDDGLLSAHKTFWNYPSSPRMNATISEMVFVPDEVTDGAYMLTIQIAPFHSDASPSRPLLFPIIDAS
ncbi:MAG: cyclase family protein [Flavobacteriales bacterium]|nr:cyclase family protein [Bacteroidota bacterium]MCB9241425.1 cyclase family protein [Flavobacteriales bacterium]